MVPSENEDHSLFILKNKATSLLAAEKFLQNRGWSVSSGVSLRELVAFLIQRQPKFILVPADFRNKKVKMLPKLLQQAFSVTIVGYVELASAQAITLLADMKLKFQIIPPISGPQIERTLLRAQKELSEGAQLQVEPYDEAGAAQTDPEFIKIAGDTRNVKVKHISGLGGLVSANALDRASMILQELLEQEKEEEQEEEQKQRSSIEQNRKIPFYEYDPVLKKNRPTPQFNFKNSSPEMKGDSILVRGTRYALDQAVRMVPYLPNFEEDQSTKSCGCLILELDHFSGYLVTAFGYHRELEKKFFKFLQEKLLTFLKSFGELPKNFESMQIEIHEVDFKEWTSRQAEFLVKSIHSQTEITIAFFPSADTQLKIGESVSKKMLALNLEEIRGDSRVEFDTYIYMPNNNRYLLYVASQGIFYKSQKDRLKKSGISFLHIRKGELAQAKKYKTQYFFNDQIELFKAKKALLKTEIPSSRVSL
jgi:hypothetical protein